MKRFMIPAKQQEPVAAVSPTKLYPPANSVKVGAGSISAQSTSATTPSVRYEIEGVREDVDNLMIKLNSHVQNPQNYKCSLKLIKPQAVHQNIIDGLTKIMDA